MGRYSNYQYALILSLAGYGLPMLLVSLTKLLSASWCSLPKVLGKDALCVYKSMPSEKTIKYIYSNNIYIYIYTKVIFIFIYIHFINLFFMFVLLYIYILSIYFYVCTFVFMSLWHHNLINLKSKVFIPNRFLWTFLYLKIKLDYHFHL